MKHLGEKIKYLRIKKGLSQSNLSMDPDNNSGISQIENGYNKAPRKELIVWIADKLDTTYDELIEDTNYSPGTVKSGLIAVSDSDFEVNEESSPESTEKEVELKKENISEDIEEVIQDKKEDDLHIKDVTNDIEENNDLEIIAENKTAATVKKSSKKEKIELDTELESDTS